MSSMNLVVLVGRVGRKPELKYSQGGMAILNLSVATTKSKKVGNEWQNEAVWHDVVVFKDKAESLAPRLDAGTQVMIEGEISYNEYLDKNKSKVKKTSILAKTVKPLVLKTYEPTLKNEPPRAPVIEPFTGGLTEDDIPF